MILADANRGSGGYPTGRRNHNILSRYLSNDLSTEGPSEAGKVLRMCLWEVMHKTSKDLILALKKTHYVGRTVFLWEKPQFWFSIRCSDPTELGSFASAILCSACKEGWITTLDPLDMNSSWQCRSCQLYLTAETVVKVWKLWQIPCAKMIVILIADGQWSGIGDEYCEQEQYSLTGKIPWCVQKVPSSESRILIKAETASRWRWEHIVAKNEAKQTDWFNNQIVSWST